MSKKDINLLNPDDLSSIMFSFGELSYSPVEFLDLMTKNFVLLNIKDSPVYLWKVINGLGYMEYKNPELFQILYE